MVEKPLQLLSSFNAFGHHIDIQVLASAMIVRTIAASLGLKNVVNKDLSIFSTSSGSRFR
jgi:hypothetical protein